MYYPTHIRRTVMNCSITDCETCPYHDTENDNCDAPEESTTKPLDKIILGD